MSKRRQQEILKRGLISGFGYGLFIGAATVIAVQNLMGGIL